MSDLDPDLQPDPGSPGDLRQKLADAEARAASAVQEATAPLERALAFAKAGIVVDEAEPNSPAAIFARGYDGELTTEAIKEAAAALNLGSATTPETPEPEAPALSDDEARLLNAGAGLGGAPPPPDAPVADPVEVAEQVFEKAHKEDGMSRPDAMGLALNSLANAANQGDKRVIIPGPGSPVPS